MSENTTTSPVPDAWTPQHDEAVQEWRKQFEGATETELRFACMQTGDMMKEAQREHALVTSLIEKGETTITTFEQSGKVRNKVDLPIEDFLTSIILKKYAYEQYFQMLLAEKQVRRKEAVIAVEMTPENEPRVQPPSERSSA